MLIDTPYGKIETIPEADDIFKIVPQSEPEVKELIKKGALIAYMRYGCVKCDATIKKLKLGNLDKLLRIARERKVALVYLDCYAIQFYGFADFMMIDDISTLAFYKDGKEVARRDRFPSSDDLADLIEQHFPIQ